MTYERLAQLLHDYGFEAVADKLEDALTDPRGPRPHGWCNERLALSECESLVALAQEAQAAAVKLLSLKPLTTLTLADGGRAELEYDQGTQPNVSRNLPRQSKHRRGARVVRFVK